jgi:hypothetical protein
MLNLQPILTGTHITLRPLAAQDFHEMFAAASDPLVWAQHPDPGRSTREGCGRGVPCQGTGRSRCSDHHLFIATIELGSADLFMAGQTTSLPRSYSCL